MASSSQPLKKARISTPMELLEIVHSIANQEYEKKAIVDMSQDELLSQLLTTPNTEEISAREIMTCVLNMYFKKVDGNLFYQALHNKNKNKITSIEHKLHVYWQSLYPLTKRNFCVAFKSYFSSPSPIHEVNLENEIPDELISMEQIHLLIKLWTSKNSLELNDVIELNKMHQRLNITIVKRGRIPRYAKYIDENEMIEPTKEILALYFTSDFTEEQIKRGIKSLLEIIDTIMPINQLQWKIKISFSTWDKSELHKEIKNINHKFISDVIGVTLNNICDFDENLPEKVLNILTSVCHWKLV